MKKECPNSKGVYAWYTRRNCIEYFHFNHLTVCKRKKGYAVCCSDRSESCIV